MINPLMKSRIIRSGPVASRSIPGMFVAQCVPGTGLFLALGFTQEPGTCLGGRPARKLRNLGIPVKGPSKDFWIVNKNHANVSFPADFHGYMTFMSALYTFIYQIAANEELDGFDGTKRLSPSDPAVKDAQGTMPICWKRRIRISPASRRLEQNTPQTHAGAAQEQCRSPVIVFFASSMIIYDPDSDLFLLLLRRIIIIIITAEKSALDDCTRLGEGELSCFSTKTGTGTRFSKQGPLQ